MYPTALFEFLDVIPIPALVSEMTGKENSDNHPIFLNAAFLEQIGYTLDEMPSIERWFEIAYPDLEMRLAAKEEWYRAVDQSLAEGRRTAEASALIRCKDGRQRWFIVTAQVRSENMPNMHVVTFRDIHDLKTLSDENHYLSQTDQLTDVSNRRAGQARLEMEVSRFERTGVPFCVIMCDVDHFKPINDRFGHMCGDYILRKVAEMLRRSCRNIDEIVRWGGDEFLLILPATDLQDAVRLAERLREDAQLLELCWDKENISTTLSMGCAVISLGQTFNELLRSADNSLYVAKRNGRNAIGS